MIIEYEIKERDSTPAGVEWFSFKPDFYKHKNPPGLKKQVKIIRELKRAKLF